MWNIQIYHTVSDITICGDNKDYIDFKIVMMSAQL